MHALITQTRIGQMQYPHYNLVTVTVQSLITSQSQTSLIYTNVGSFSSKCRTNGRLGTTWFHKITCGCELKALVDYFRKKVGRYYRCFRQEMVCLINIFMKTEKNQFIANQKHLSLVPVILPINCMRLFHGDVWFRPFSNCSKEHQRFGF